MPGRIARAAVSLLTEPMLRSYLLKGLAVSQGELETGAITAYNTVWPMLHKPSDVLTDRVEPTLLRELTAPPGKLQLPWSSEAINARLNHVSIIVGAERDGFDHTAFSRRVSVGDHLHVVAKEGELGGFR
eukprot:TRINITY_DN19544_c0_g1_i4.p2 TRINITY_DN19544_c0_g1~~TRINITY_DN19544_c0_g1_i4.p2  ORF type:complete len:130 (+),score=20.87 TRINITY_DN19544_c0_g1_i4:219-608(+)